MVKQASLWLSLIIAPTAFSQTLNDVPEVKLNLHSKDIVQLFNLSEIKAAGFRKAFLVKTWGYRDAEGNAEHKDTIRVYGFNSEGQPEMVYWYSSIHRVKLDTIFPKKEVHGFSYDSVLTSKTNSGSGTKMIQHLLWSHEDRLDTAFIIRTVFNKNGQLIEKQVMPTKFLRKFVDCWVGEPPYHFKYNYDEKGRTILVENIIEKEYHVISYPRSGEEMITYDSQTRKEKCRTFTMILDNEWQRTITNDDVQLIVTKLEKGSQLVSAVTVVPNLCFASPSYFEFFYE